MNIKTQPTNDQQGALIPYAHYPALLLTAPWVALLISAPQHAASKELPGSSLWRSKYGKSCASFRNSHITTRPAEQLPGSGALRRLQSEPNGFCRGVAHSGRPDYALSVWDSLLHAHGCFCICAGWLFCSCQDPLVVSCWAVVACTPHAGPWPLSWGISLLHFHFNSCFACFTHWQTMLL